jgi:hypothetical protein
LRSARADFLVIVVGRILQVAYAIAAVRIVTAMLAPDQVGRRDLVLSVTSWFALLLISPVGNFLNRHGVEWQFEGRLLEVLRRFGFFVLSVTVVAAIVVTVLSLTSGIGTPISIGWLLCLVAGSLFVGTLTTQFSSLLNIIGCRGWYVVLANVASWFGLVISLALTSWRARNAEYWLSGILLGQLLALAGSVFVLRRVEARPAKDVLAPGSGHSSQFDVRSVIQFSLPLITSTACYWAQTSGYRFILAGRTDVAMVGLLTVGLTVASAPLAMFDNMFSDYYRPFFYKAIAFSTTEMRAEAWNRYASAYFPAVLLAAAFFGLAGPFIARFLVSAPFRSVAWLASWGAVLQATIGIYSVYALLSHASLNTSVLIRPNVIGAAVTLIGVFATARWEPLLGPAAAMSIGMLVTLIDTARILHSDFELRLPWRRVGLATLMAMPLVACLTILRRRYQNPTELQAITVLVGGAFYLILAQFVLARDWLFRRALPPAFPSAVAMAGPPDDSGL